MWNRCSKLASLLAVTLFSLAFNSAALAYTDCLMEPTRIMTGGEGSQRFVEICETLSPGVERCVSKTAAQLSEPKVFLDRLLMVATTAQVGGHSFYVRFSQNNYDCSTNWISRDDFGNVLINR